MAESLDAIIDERDELMISPTGDGNPTFRRGHYLKPSVKPVQEPDFEFPSLFIPPKPTIPEVENLPLKVNYKGWRCPQKNWNEWVDSLHSKQQSTWKKAGIYEAILSSTYKVQSHNGLIVAVAKSWCPEINCFVFPGGAATITLEDMMILGGYSVLGDSFSERLETDDMRKIKGNLTEVHKQISVARKVRHCPWMNYFMGTGHELEHEAFLSLWLSRYVVPTYLYDNIGKHCFPIAIRLARGIRIALAPVVLASIYRDLRLLKYNIDAARSTTNENKGGILVLDLWAPFLLAQLWIWERFPTLRPKPNLIKHGEPRVARWHMVKGVKIEKVRLVIDSSGDSFQWRPYAPVFGNWSSSKLYRDEEEWASLGPNLDIELESFARCLRVSELVGLHCIEQYLPHRVAMQFGMDQDIPGRVPRFNTSQEIAWNNYCRPIIDEKIYIPARLFESDVTTRYLKWWKQSMFAQEDPIKYFVRRPRNTRRLPRIFAGKMEGNHVCVPPGLSMKCQKVDEKESVKEAKQIGTSRAPINDENKLAADVKSFSVSYCKSISQSVTNDGAAKRDFLMIPLTKIMQGEGSMGEPGKILADASVIEVGFPDKPTVQQDRNISEQIPRASIWKKGGDGADVPLGFPPKFNKVKAGNSVNVDKPTVVKDKTLPKQVTQAFVGKKEGNDADVPPGFPPKNKKFKVENPIKEDTSESEGKRFHGTHDSLDKGPIGGGKHVLGESQSFSASAIVGALKKEPMIRSVENIEGEGAIDRLERATEATINSKAAILVYDGLGIDSNERKGSSHTPEIPGLELEARVSRLEKVVAELEAARFSSRFENIAAKEGWPAP
ncbi:uncharacterized protein LOC121236702 [Juglans microcarpa x Juglans regia]|uniref:uncharacterized protein LOC121236702 n=1 Tax=Juglans microcarpa x Juglans regia TaxID=2249226 RepID=UPI001B7F268D|nr:uncharacterized protein LOC121236702 [Juglans microcarpa x Juglans regia]